MPGLFGQRSRRFDQGPSRFQQPSGNLGAGGLGADNQLTNFLRNQRDQQAFARRRKFPQVPPPTLPSVVNDLTGGGPTASVENVEALISHLFGGSLFG